MLQFLEEANDDLVALRISAKVDKDDYDVMLPVLEEKIRQHGKIRVYAELMNVETYTLKALWEEIKFDFKHLNNFSKAAIVGDAPWMNMVTVMAKPFTSAQVKHFDLAHRSDAWAWVNA
ncbi:STAS/SEC14 domain-containing protein [Pontibacter sp. 172403-2]|uniref:STAS/SEC14 domain-containing protein n=1 Tax=Pontibacter rufus TaxID=2791028 RepID=UPI0018AF949B|nr:STAS/SEC14 domain-containing protein [Pontibacter sp. 172403-2]MBF9253425.1 STAS/SEC14 domain-containing protein [Pontibacter sp. 172403-2]